jgi:hypothetical protein
MEEMMTWLPIDADQLSQLPNAGTANTPGATIPTYWRVAGMVLRTAFIVSMLVVIVHVSMPQTATIWTSYNTPGDLIRLALGLAVAVWLAAQLFIVPKDAHAYRTWLFLGLAAVPFALICIVGIW